MSKNIINVRTPDGKLQSVEYGSFMDLVTYVTSNNLSNPTSERNKATTLLIPANITKAAFADVERIALGFQLKIEKVDSLSWESINRGSLATHEAAKAKGAKDVDAYLRDLGIVQEACERLDKNMTIGKCSFAIPLRNKQK